MRLRAQGFRDAAGIVELAQQALQLGAIAEGGDVSDGAAADHDRHPANHEDSIGGQHHLVGTGDLPDQQIANSAWRQDLRERPSQAVAGQS